jgi:hypothetical protein
VLQLEELDKLEILLDDNMDDNKQDKKLKKKKVLILKKLMKFQFLILFWGEHLRLDEFMDKQKK